MAMDLISRTRHGVARLRPRIGVGKTFWLCYKTYQCLGNRWNDLAAHGHSSAGEAVFAAGK